MRAATAKKFHPVPLDTLAHSILLIRGQKVMLGSVLAELYKVEPRALIQAVKRNASRFPADFMFQLTDAECANLKSQSVISSWGGARRANPYAFTELGVAMLSSVLHSRRAIQMNIDIMRAFVRIRDLLINNKALAARIEKLERGHKDHASIIAILAAELDGLKRLPAPKSRPIGFTANLDD